ncbi:glycoside hydrolase [Mycena latifolia]|nr:glycoside hydrolase [Mycena latifolia]
MVYFRLTSLATIAPIFLYFGRSYSAAVGATATSNSLGVQPSDVSARRINSLPHFVAYSDQDTPGTIGPPATSDISGAFDKAQEWTSLSSAQRKSIKAAYTAAGIKLIVSAFGSTDKPTTSGADPIATANTMGQWVIKYDLDGVDVDYEDFTAFDAGDGQAEAWVISFTTQLRTLLPQGKYIITHAQNLLSLTHYSAVAPWFSPNIWGGGGYLRVHESVGSLIDWYNIQHPFKFYNQGPKEYTTCSTLLAESSTQWPQTALFQIAANGVPLQKLVLGKPATNTSASDGYIPPSTLAGCLATAKSGGWSAGVSVWEYPGAAAAWIQTVRASSWAVNASDSNSPTSSS